MQIIPAIDMRAGKCVRLLQGRAEQHTVCGHDPVAMAQRWVEAGTPMLHVVDLDGAFAGQLQNFAVIERLVHAVPVPVQVGGGMRALSTIVAVLASGVSSPRRYRTGDCLWRGGHAGGSAAPGGLAVAGGCGGYCREGPVRGAF